jgi:hypothetical protein
MSPDTCTCLLTRAYVPLHVYVRLFPGNAILSHSILYVCKRILSGNQILCMQGLVYLIHGGENYRVALVRVGDPDEPHSNEVCMSDHTCSLRVYVMPHSNEVCIHSHIPMIYIYIYIYIYI